MLLTLCRDTAHLTPSGVFENPQETKSPFPTYLIHDNGGRPFKVAIRGDMVSVYKIENIEDITRAAHILLLPNNFIVIS